MKNKRTNLSLLLSTCDSYMPLWEGFFKSFSNHFKDDIDLFVGTNDQFDDITMLCVEFKGHEK